MADKLRFIQGDTRPNIIVDLLDESTGAPINLVGAVPKLKIRAAGDTTVLQTINGSLLTGYLQDGYLNESAPYDTPGFGGRCLFPITPDTTAAMGEFVGEVETTFADGGVQTALNRVRFKVLEQF